MSDMRGKIGEFVGRRAVSLTGVQIVISVLVEEKPPGHRQRLNLKFILGRLLILLVIAFIIGMIFGARGYMTVVDFWHLSPDIVQAGIIYGPLIIGLGLILFLMSGAFLKRWYIYPIIGYLFPNMIIEVSPWGRSLSETYSTTEHLTASFGIFAVYAVVFLVITVTEIARKKYHITVSGVAGLVIVLLIPSLIYTVHANLTAVFTSKPVQPAFMEGISISSTYSCPDYYAKNHSNCNAWNGGTEGFYNTITYGDTRVLDGLQEIALTPDEKITSLFAATPLCIYKGVQRVNNSGAPPTVTRQTGRTPMGVKYSITSAKAGTLKGSDGVSRDITVYDYCFYLTFSAYEYHITRLEYDSPSLGAANPKNVYERYPIETIIDLFAK